MAIHTLYELVRNSVDRFASRVAFSMFEGEETTYAEVGRRIEKVQQELTGAGLRPGDRVALLSSNMSNWGVCYLAVVSAGMVVVPILPDFSGEELDMIIEHSEAKALMVSDKLFTKLSKPTIERLHVVVRTKNLGVIAQRVKGEGATAVPQPDDLAAVIYTSGTTSKPKGVMLTHRALCAQIAMSAAIFPVDGDDVFLSVLPLSHTYECSIGMIYPFSMGARVVYIDRPPTASVLMPTLRAVRPTVMLIVPLIIEKIYRHQVLAKFNSTATWRTLYRIGFMRRYFHRVAGKKLMKLFGRRLRFLGIGGSKLDGGAEKFLLEAKVPYAIGYGLTETAPLLAGAAPSMVRLGSTGPQAPGVELRLDNVNTETRQGEIVARTPSAMLGYFKNPEATAEAFTADGWFRTGDLGEFDKDGWLYIKGRLKNMIVGPGGENIYPEDIESVLNSHVCIADSIVTEQEGRLVALVHFNRDEIEAMIDDWREEWETKKEAWEAKTEQLKQEIMEFVNAKVSRFSRISEVVEEKEEFVKTPTQKIRRFLYNGKRGTDAAASATSASTPAASTPAASAPASAPAEGDDAAKR
ncbi:AMP-binding protein [uncultured Alistipes sp.]|uniref:AMP-binding protein n=1 Tax=uncultured Alistipes sp. TaxID=538949 RepID=UPI002614E53A|nr:AMP-binding protein [uncultured Alistipes sp.]